MKPLTTRNVEIYFNGKMLLLEIEEFKTVFHVYFIDRRKYFSHVATLKFQKSKFTSTTYIANVCRDYAIDKRYF